MKYLIIAICLVASIVVLLKYLENKKWEDLIEDKQETFNQTKGLKNKQSLVYRDAACGLCVVAVCVSLLPVNFLSFTSKSADTASLVGNKAVNVMDEAMSDEKYVAHSLQYVWKHSAINDYTKNYDLAKPAEANLTNLIDEFTLTENEVNINVRIYQETDGLYAQLGDYGTCKLVKAE